MFDSFSTTSMKLDETLKIEFLLLFGSEFDEIEFEKTDRFTESKDDEKNARRRRDDEKNAQRRRNDEKNARRRRNEKDS